MEEVRKRRSSETVIESLKANLKIRGLSYRDLAKAWDISQSSVKRIMSSTEISLDRVEKACDLMDLSLGDFFHQIRFESRTDFFYLTPEQETKLAKDAEGLHYFLLLQHGWKPSEIIRRFSIPADRNVRLLNQLEKIGLIEVLPQGKIKQKYLSQLRFRKEGPIGKLLEKQVKTEFLESSFARTDEYFTFLTLSYSPSMSAKLKMRLTEISKELVADSDQQRSHPNSQEYGLVIAMRPWKSPLLKALVPRKERS
jgi:transcriptional regulator with XRE-family HTH domain